jgi:hypothetical protein
LKARAIELCGRFVEFHVPGGIIDEESEIKNQPCLVRCDAAIAAASIQ